MNMYREKQIHGTQTYLKKNVIVTSESITNSNTDYQLINYQIEYQFHHQLLHFQFNYQNEYWQTY